MTRAHGVTDPSHDPERRIRALASLLVENGVITSADIDRELRVQAGWSATEGARLVARAWTDEAFRSRLTSDAASAAGELNIDTSAMARFEVVENTAGRHHVIVCTLCSCYPRPVLGQPPDWYKSAAYRARVVREPRVVLAEFGLQLPGDMEIVVVDSTADRRFMVLPRRPHASEGLSESQLAALVTRDSMIGVAEPLTVAPAG